jgi:hypothetical protein
LVFCRGEDGPVSESQNVAGEIVFGLHPPGYEHFVLGANAHQSLVKGPVAHSAEGKAV